MENMTELVDT